jgi:N-acetylglucosaminyldiphosphoundecaprenol N-acetyl-beta-D-mannosaminyltransferase
LTPLRSQGLIRNHSHWRVGLTNVYNNIANDSRARYLLFGLPVDNLDMAETKALMRKIVKDGKQVVLSTINVNWVVTATRDCDFRVAILDSDIVVLDGKPLLWLSKLRGYPMREVVPGSTLIQELHQDKTEASPLTIFLFGGENGVARKAMERINSNRGGLKAVGALNPGFGTIAQISTPAIIETINQTRPDILLVALGAKKGTQWIAHNRHRLNAKIISHLGATINFMAGTVERAPRLMRKLGLEWLWRICQEPKLFTRYAGDGLVLLRLVFQRAY